MNKINLRAKLAFNRWYLNHLRFHYPVHLYPEVGKMITNQCRVIKALERKVDESDKAKRKPRKAA